ncbi:MAG TPA: heparinase II/III family protein [Arachnia sp.]|nr:heparinase II/III family protein [Arachnia sp.]HMT86764.1 heparinase II/III family protein [Arachnia sp.]
MSASLMSRSLMSPSVISRRAFRGPLRDAFPDILASALSPSLLRAADDALPCPPATERRVWDLSAGSADHVAHVGATDDATHVGSADHATLRAQIDRAEKNLGAPWPLPLASTAARMHRDGDRTAHENLVFARQLRLGSAAVAAAATLEARFVDEVADGVLQLCEQSSWCWPAHDDAFAVSGSVLPDPARPYLDLGAGEVAAQLAWIDHLLGAPLDRAYPGLRARIRHEARHRVFQPFLSRHDWHWLGLDGDVHNWNPWIHGNVLVAALRLLDAEEEAAERALVVELAIAGLDRYLAVLPPDGATDEGYHYWWNGACRALEALDVLDHATAGRLDALSRVAALRATVGFPHRMQLSDDWVLNLADGAARLTGEVAWDALHRAARRIGDRDAEAFAASHRHPGRPVAPEETTLGRLLRAATDPDWVSADTQPPPLPADVWLESIQVRLVRERPGRTDGLTLAVKGGHNDEHHNHNDVGEVVVASGGVPVLVDAGRPTYTAATFGPDRYSLWMMQSLWHNVPVIRGAGQSAGRRFRATAVEPLASGLALDLAPAYPVPGLERWRRVARLVGGTVEISDSWHLAPWEGEDPEPRSQICFLAAGRTTVDEGGARIVPLDGAPPVRLSWPEPVPVSTTTQPLDDPMLSNVWGEEMTRIELDVTGLTQMTVTVSPEGVTS